MEDKRKILEAFVEKLKSIMGTSLKKVILYGSYARGDFNVNSDLDIMILTDMDELQIKQIEDKVYDSAFDYELEGKTPISVNIKNMEHFQYWMDSLPYYKNIEREGIQLV